MTILVTGATGYLGREFVKTNSHQYNIITLVRESSDITQLESLNCTISKFKNFSEIENVFSEYSINGILHFASNVTIEHTQEDISTLLDSNIKYGTYLLEYCKKYNVKWFINTGTFWQNYKDEEYNPVNLYAATKQAFENVAKYYTQVSSLVFTTIKLNDTFGPNDTRLKIFNLWDKYSKSEEVLNMSKGEQIINISFIEDIINAFNTMIHNLENDVKNVYNNKCFVVSAKQKIPLKELSKIFEKVTHRKLNINWGGRPYRNREVMLPYCDGILVPNWEQKYTLEEAIVKTLREIK